MIFRAPRKTRWRARNYFDIIRFTNNYYQIKLRFDCGSDPNNQTCAGVNLTGTMTVTSTGNWNNFRVFSKRGVQLSAGTHVLRLKMDTNSPDMCGCVVGNFDAISFKSTQFDYDNDGRADISLFRPSNGTWYVQNSSNSTTSTVVFGLSTDIITPADYDGDGKTDIGVFRPSTGGWSISRSTEGGLTETFGQSGDTPNPSAYVR